MRIEANGSDASFPSSLIVREQSTEVVSGGVVITLRLELRSSVELARYEIDGSDVATLRPFWRAVLARLLAPSVATQEAAEPKHPSLALERSSRVGAAAGPKRGILQRDGDSWIIGYDGVKLRIRHLRGFAILVHLLRSPGEELHVRVLDARTPTRMARRASLPGQTPNGDEILLSGLGDAGETLDFRALAEYRRRIAELRGELAEAERCRDLGRAERARAEIEGISQQLTSAIGIGSRPRRVCSDVERLRVSITRRIRVAIAEIGERIPALGHHLLKTVRTGCFCAYQPLPAKQVEWEL